MTAGVAVEALSLTLGGFRLDGVDFALSAGEILVVLGPNGAGKSVTLETIAGFHRPERGRVLLGGRDVTALPPERRNIGFVVQNFGLFPHLTVEKNVAIAQRRGRAGVAGAATLPPSGDIAALLGYFGVAKLARRLPAELSPGEKQRVALARAVAGAPELFLFDEPFAALDSQTREQLRGELKAFLRALAVPAIFVTHDHDDAMMLADTIVVLRDGVMMQRGGAAEIFRKPANSFVARFVGVDNILDGRIAAISGTTTTLAIANRVLRAAAPAPAPGAGPPPPPAQSATAGQAVRVGIRAEEVTLVLPSSLGAPAPELNRLDGTIVGLRAAAPLVTIEIDCGFALTAYALAPAARAMRLAVGSPVAVEIATDAVHVMPD